MFKEKSSEETETLFTTNRLTGKLIELGIISKQGKNKYLRYSNTAKKTSGHHYLRYNA